MAGAEQQRHHHVGTGPGDQLGEGRLPGGQPAHLDPGRESLADRRGDGQHRRGPRRVTGAVRGQHDGRHRPGARRTGPRLPRRRGCSRGRRDSTPRRPCGDRTARGGPVDHHGGRGAGHQITQSVSLPESGSALTTMPAASVPACCGSTSRKAPVWRARA
ncbi:hypothetical protein SDC9_117575 [bioreactor metagenome]|uniref:Uncharacterized protein n=1 Tax=bioreactor metagenome TaxID=1076179 RepID=A0A645BYP4_9ZZZZ